MVPARSSDSKPVYFIREPSASQGLVCCLDLPSCLMFDVLSTQCEDGGGGGEKEIKTEDKHLSCSAPPAPGNYLEQGEVRARGQKSTCYDNNISVHSDTAQCHIAQIDTLLTSYDKL